MKKVQTSSIACLCKDNYMLPTEEVKYIQKMKNGSHRAFNLLYENYASSLYSYCLKWTKSQEESEEIVQDVFMKLWLNREQIKNEDTILYLLFKMAKNQLINIYRKNLSSPIYEEYVEYNNSERFYENSADSNINYDEFCNLVEQIKKNLPETQQQIFEYNIFQQKKNQEIADLLGLSEQTVRNQLSLALKVFRKKLKEPYWIILLTLIN